MYRLLPKRRMHPNPSGGLRSPVRAGDAALSANMSETVTPWKFSVEGESGSEANEPGGAAPR